MVRNIILALFVSTVVARADAQNITVTEERPTAATVMRAVERQAGFRFSYNKNLFDPSRTVVLSSQTVSLAVALDRIVAGQNVTTVIHKNHIAIVPVAPATALPEKKTEAARTSDVYVPANPDSNTVTPRPEPILTPPPVAVAIPASQAKTFHIPLAVFGEGSGRLSRFAIKTDLLYGATALTPNIAVEAALSRRATIEAGYSSNPWLDSKRGPGEPGRKLLHGVVRIEGRWWSCDRFSGHFVGVHALYAEFNVVGLNFPLLFDERYRYRGHATGVGAVYGYDLPVAKRWNVEFTAGVGIYGISSRRYSCVTCDVRFTRYNKVWIGPSRLGVNLEYLIR